jgi:DNA primase
MIPATFIEELVSRVDVVELVGRYVQLRKSGANHMGLCPFHTEKSPSFTVNASKQFYHCFGCGAHGDAIGFLVEHHGMGFIDAVKELAGQVGMNVPEVEDNPAERERAQKQREQQMSIGAVLERAADFYRAQLKHSALAVAYLKGRGLSGEVARQFGIGYAPDSWRPLANTFARYDDPLLVEAGLVISSGSEEGAEEKRYDRFRGRIMFPIRSVKGDVIGFGARIIEQGEPKYLNSPETPVFVKGRELYGLYEARQALRARGHALVVEGYMDVVALAQHGLGHAVATLGTACTREHVQKLLRFTDSIVFSFDGDAAGRRAATRALEAALPEATDTRHFSFLFLPKEHDPDSFVREMGVEAFERAIKEALPLSGQLLAVAGEGCNLDTPEGRARLLANAKPLWNLLPEGGLMRQQMMAELASQARLEPPDLAAAWGLGRRAGPPAARPPRAPASTVRSIRRAPAGPADHTLRFLLRQPDWWDRLAADDHEMLAGLPEPHGPLCVWLEHRLHEHGAEPWSLLRQALADQPALAEAAEGLMAAISSDDPPPFEELLLAVNQLWRNRLELESRELAPLAAHDAQARQRYVALLNRLRALRG